MQHFDYRKFRKTLIAALGAGLFAVSQAYTDNPWVQSAVAVATVFGVYQVPNDLMPRQG
jgi:hypothetical protein